MEVRKFSEYFFISPSVLFSFRGRVGVGFCDATYVIICHVFSGVRYVPTFHLDPTTKQFYSRFRSAGSSLRIGGGAISFLIVMGHFYKYFQRGGS